MLSELQGTLVPARQGSDAGASEYQLVRWLAGGSFGKVFLVLHRGENKEYVMKEVASFDAMEPSKREATELEVHLLREVQHPNIVTYRDSYVNQGGHLCIFMEFCEHGDVHTYLQGTKRSGKATPAEAQVLEWLVQITLALQALHSRKILHRDLKTQNVFLSGRLRKQHQGFALKLGDLGIARVLDSSVELAATQIGTPFSMSPEVFNNKPYGYESDVWGLGCVFYELVNGTHAFEAQSINGLALKILRGRYTPITAGCSEETKQLIKWMLNTTPRKRPGLQDILQASQVRRQVPAAVKVALEVAETQGARGWAEEVLAAQLQTLGLEDCLQASFASGGGALANGKGRQQALQRRIGRAERRQRREEETLKRLQETAEVLKTYFHDTAAAGPSAQPVIDKGGGRGATAVSSNGYGGLASQGPPSGGYGGHASRPSHVSGRGRLLPPPLAPLPQGQHGAATASLSGRSGQEGELSHRDRVLLRKEQRREEEQQRFEQEARKIREENLAYQRAWVQGSRDQHGHAAGPARAAPAARDGGGGAGAAVDSAGGRHGRPPAPLQPLADNPNPAHELTANPSRSSRPQVGHTPRSRHQSADAVTFAPDVGRLTPRLRHRGSSCSSIGEQPCPPPFRYGDPAPPGKLPRPRWSHWGSGVTDAGVTTRSLNSICLESLAPERSDDSDASHSCSEASDDGLRSARAPSDERLWRQSQDVQRRIAQCRAAISRHKRDLEALHEAYADEQAASRKRFGSEPASRPSARAVASVPASPRKRREAEPSPSPPPLPRAAAAAPQPAATLAPAATGAAAAPAPPLVQDRVARLRRRCLEGLGAETFQAARQSLQALLSSEELATTVRQRMLDMLGLDKIGYYSLIDQIVHLEQRWGRQDPDLVRGSYWASDVSDASGIEPRASRRPPRAGAGTLARSRSPG